MTIALWLACTEAPVAPGIPSPPPASTSLVTVPAPALPGVVGFDPACDDPGTVCLWLGSPGYAGITAEGLPRVGPDPSVVTLAYLPLDLAFADDGTGYFLDYNNHRIRRVALDDAVRTVSGTGLLGDGPANDGGAVDCWLGCDALSSAWNHPSDVAWHPGAPDLLWIAAGDQGRVSLIDLVAGTTTWFAGGGGDPLGATDVDGDGSVLDDVRLGRPSSVLVGDDGTVYVSDTDLQVVRALEPDGGIAIVAGQLGVAGYDGDGGPAADATLRLSRLGGKLALDGRTLYVADTDNGVVRAIDLDSGTIDTVAGRFVEPAYPGRSEPGYAGDGGPALDAVLSQPADVAVGPDGELYVADRGNRCVRVVADGVIDGFAGVCGGDAPEYSGDGGPALDARFGPVFGVAIGPDGDVYVADTDHQVIRRVRR